MAGLLGLVYLLFWPVDLAPVAWQAPPNPGYTGAFAENRALTDAELLDLGAYHGPEDLALDPQGRVYVSTHEGAILRLDGDAFVEVAQTKGRPLGITFDAEGTLWVADAYRGLLAINPATGAVRVALSEVNSVPLRYADHLDFAPNGDLWLSDACTKWGAEANGGTLEASLPSLLEHGGHGRLIRYDPRTGEAFEVLTGLNFPNGIAVDPQGAFVLVAETGSYRLLRYHLKGPKTGTHDTFAGPFPGFPDNIKRGTDGLFRVGLTSPRKAIVDALAGWPRVRTMVWRLPGFVRPGPGAYGHLLTFDRTGKQVADHQDPSGRVSFITGGLVAGDHLYLSSLKMNALPRIRRPR